MTNAIVTTLQAVPELVAMLGDAAAIRAYIDLNPDNNSVVSAIYTMKPGTVMVAHIETAMVTTESMSMWSHTLHIFVKAGMDQSALDIVNAIVDGTPNPGDGQRWRYCPVMDGTEPPELTEIMRETDTEGIDYHVITTAIAETGDDNYYGIQRSRARRTTAAARKRG